MAPPQPNLPQLCLSRDAGGYYCAHTLFLHTELAQGLRTCRAPDGGVLVGFLHIPDGPATYAQGDHDHTVLRGVVAHALDAMTRRSQGPQRILLTGFGPFNAVTHNPSGEFVLGPVADLSPHRIYPHSLAVDDVGLQTLMELHEQIRPTVALSMGVVADGEFEDQQIRIETMANNRNLRRGRHQPGAPAQLHRPVPALAMALGAHLTTADRHLLSKPWTASSNS